MVDSMDGSNLNNWDNGNTNMKTCAAEGLLFKVVS